MPLPRSVAARASTASQDFRYHDGESPIDVVEQQALDSARRTSELRATQREQEMEVALEMSAQQEKARRKSEREAARRREKALQREEQRYQEQMAEEHQQELQRQANYEYPAAPYGASNDNSMYGYPQGGWDESSYYGYGDQWNQQWGTDAFGYDSNWGYYEQPEAYWAPQSITVDPALTSGRASDVDDTFITPEAFEDRWNALEDR